MNKSIKLNYEKNLLDFGVTEKCLSFLVASATPSAAAAAAKKQQQRNNNEEGEKKLKLLMWCRSFIEGS